MPKITLLLHDAQATAGDLFIRIAPACERLLIAGSIRRKKPEIGDIELVAVPHTAPVLDMFGMDTGATVSALDTDLTALGVTFTKNGPKFKQFHWEGMPVDLFVTTPPQWGLIATIRTGPSTFSQRLVTPRRHGGLLPSHMRVKDGWLWETHRFHDEAIAVPEEADLFQVLGLEWIEPWNRQ